MVVDTFAKLRDPTTRKGYRADYAELGAMKRLADARGLGLLLVHHLTKARGNDPFQHFSGSVGLTAAADTLLHLSRRRGAEQCVLRTTGRDVEESELGLRFVKGRFALEAKPPDASPEVSLSPERRAILEFIRLAVGPVAPHVVSTGLGLHPGGTRKLMVLMREQGVLVRGDGGYTAAPPGAAAPATAISAATNVVAFRAGPRPVPTQG